jgi:hypothetical protein
MHTPAPWQFHAESGLVSHPVGGHAVSVAQAHGNTPRELAGNAALIAKAPLMCGALEALCLTIEATGGIEYGSHGEPMPLADPEWIDMGEAYLTACNVLGREPMVKDDGL